MSANTIATPRPLTRPTVLAIIPAPSGTLTEEDRYDVRLGRAAESLAAGGFEGALVQSPWGEARGRRLLDAMLGIVDFGLRVEEPVLRAGSVGWIMDDSLLRNGLDSLRAATAGPAYLYCGGIDRLARLAGSWWPAWFGPDLAREMLLEVRPLHRASDGWIGDGDDDITGGSLGAALAAEERARSRYMGVEAVPRRDGHLWVGMTVCAMFDTYWRQQARNGRMAHDELGVLTPAHRIILTYPYSADRTFRLSGYMTLIQQWEHARKMYRSGLSVALLWSDRARELGLSGHWIREGAVTVPESGGS